MEARTPKLEKSKLSMQEVVSHFQFEIVAGSDGSSR